MSRTGFLPALACALVLAVAPGAFAQTASAPVPAEAAPAPRPDERMKLDVLLIVAHPDDETAIASYLARAVFDEHKRVGVAYITDGEGGGNQVAAERAASLAAVRQYETRKALDELGIERFWFLSGKDTATQNVLFSLANWPEAPVLEEVVRLVRLTRPEVIVSWMPRPVSGENHGDHQASGVVATEAFDMAGDPAVFPGQLAPPRLRLAAENLRPWQAKKLYFFSDAFDASVLDGRGPSYATDAKSPSKAVPYAFIGLRASRWHQTQFAPGFPKPLLDAIERGDVEGAGAIARAAGRKTGEPLRLALGKSLVGGSPSGDVFENIAPGPIEFAPAARRALERPIAARLELDGPWAFYREFWPAHGLGRLGEPFPLDVAVRPAAELHVPLRLTNGGDTSLDVTLVRASPLPPGWVEVALPSRYRLAPGDTYPIDVVLTSPATAATVPVELTYRATAGDVVLGTVTLRVLVRLGTMPQ